MTRRSYSATAVPTTLAVGIGAGDTSLTIADATGWPDGTNGPFVLTLKRGQSGEEKILATSRSGTTLSPVIRGYEGTTAVAHSAPETVEHTLSKTDLDEANAHINTATLDDHPQYSFFKKSLAAVRGAAGRVGKLHYGIDSGLLGVDDGTTWHEFQDKAAADAAYLAKTGGSLSGALVVSSTGIALTATGAGTGNLAAFVQTGGAANVGLSVRGAASQSANLQEWQNSSGTPLAYVNAAGGLLATGLSAYNAAPSVVPLVTRGAASQSANLAEFQSSAGTVLASVDPTGIGTFATLVITSAGTLSSASAGGASALPATPVGYVRISINGTVRSVPYYA